jgi:tetratricopeptide (TPR) repeat protein
VSETAPKKEQVWEIEDPGSAPLALSPESGGRDPEAEADEAYASGKWGQARTLYETVHHERPSDRHILARLVEVVRHLHDDPGEVHYLSLLGDAWIAESEYEEALECFLRILQLDPGNGAAQRRLARFRELGIKGAEAIREADSNALPGILEAGRTEVAVKGGDGFRTEDWVELEGLLEEFKTGLKNQMDESDYQAHYDLAVSHHSMGLVGEALEEVDVALACKELPQEVERRARELRGSCLMDLQRYREAVHEFREAAERAGEDRSARRAALYNLGRSLEAVEEWQEATETYTRLHLEARGLLDVESRLRHCESQLAKVNGPALGRNRDSSESDRSEADNAA